MPKIFSGVKCPFLSFGHRKTLRNYSHFGTPNWQSQKTAKYLTGISWSRRDIHSFCPFGAVTTQQDGWGLKTEYFVCPFHKGALPVCPSVCYFTVTGIQNKSEDCKWIYGLYSPWRFQSSSAWAKSWQVGNHLDILLWWSVRGNRVSDYLLP